MESIVDRYPEVACLEVYPDRDYWCVISDGDLGILIKLPVTRSRAMLRSQQHR
ncbi:hypothetical protein [Chamaesiphon sp. OTE_75_metabat_556]|uniref:hypothetical protein n=1 Tax=Chamaesiphon sp. OTE_75_metabat_556 TaxID=2964692 RepID=UPI00286CE26A|nr:hypothetical protein [Chamaesiphon sp. OTE_75_metabat_556]